MGWQTNICAQRRAAFKSNKYGKETKLRRRLS